MARIAARAGEVAPAPPAQRVKLLTRVAAFYHQTLIGLPEGLRYLDAVRGLHDLALFKSFQIGFANGSLLEVLPKDRETLAQLKALGVLTAAGQEFFGGCVVFPLWSADGAIINLYGWRAGGLATARSTIFICPVSSRGCGITRRASDRPRSC